ncbi:MAG: threonyl-tRNA synthetase [Actinomycetota bacterium]|nr:threonyl-tRNA synthetase [Actinomycetota bacterium]
MPDLRITVDGSERQVAAGTTAADVFDGDRSVVAARVGDELRDLAHVLADGDRVEPVAIDSRDGRDILRHSTAHVMAQAVQELYPEAKLGIGPPIENGFYYDFDVPEPFTPEDLSRIDKRMQQIVKEGQTFSRRAVSDEDARVELADEPYKLELIGLKGSGAADAADGAEAEVGAGELTIYDNHRRDGELAWKDLCRGPHVPTTRLIPAFKLQRSAAAYWRGSEKNKQLQRIYGTAWESRDALKDYQQRLAEAEKRDHRKLGAELDLYSFPDEIGSGLAVFHPKGGVIKRVMEDYVRARHLEEGFEYVGTPHISKQGLFETSGHLPYYAETMFPPMEMEGSNYYLKAMNCPMHNLIFRSRGRSYRELPMRLFEFGSVYRFEKSGVVHGLTRVRGLTMDDSHSYVTADQAPGEIQHLLSFILGLLKVFGLDDFYLELSTRDPGSDKFIGSDEQWEEATKILSDAATDTGLELVPDPGGAAYYGPKISVQARDAIGRTWQMSTIQYDFNQPARFGLEYQAADGSRQQPVMIHSAKFGSIERFMGVLVEHYAGAFPPWLAPVQVVGIPITDEHVPYLQDVAARLRERGIRVEVDTSDDRMQKKIRNAQKQKVPYMLLAGDEDVAKDAVSFRYRSGEQKNAVPVDEAVEEIVRAVADRVQV